MKKYLVLGAHPGNGSVVWANNTRQALAKHLANEYGHTEKEAYNEIKSTPLIKVGKHDAEARVHSAV